MALFDQDVIACNFIKPDRTDINMVLDSSPVSIETNFGNTQPMFYVGFNTVTPVKQLKKVHEQSLGGLA
jgi:hypothetical protein